MPVSGGDHTEVGKCRLPPAQELIAFLIALEFDLGIELGGIGSAEFIHHHRVIDDQLGRRQGIDLVGVAAQGLHGIAHGGQVDHAGNAGEVLQHHARGGEGNFGVRFGLGIPVHQGIDIGAGDVHPIFGAQQVFQEDLKGVGQPGKPVALHGVQPINFIFATGHCKGGARFETVCHR